MPEFKKPRKVETPEDLLNLWNSYKQYIDSNPHIEEVATAKGVMCVNRPQPYLRKGFESFIYDNYNFHIHQYIDNYDNRYEMYLGVVTHMRNQWEENQISGTLTGRFKAPNLVARLNGLVEKQETEIKGSLSIPNMPDIGNRE